MFACPVCGYRGLPEPPSNFSICPSCGTEFELDDAKMSHAQLRHAWISSGAHWFSRVRPHPNDWNPWFQLITSGYEADVPFTISIGMVEEEIIAPVDIVLLQNSGPVVRLVANTVTQGA